MKAAEALRLLPCEAWVTSGEVGVQTYLLNALYAANKIERRATGKGNPQWEYRRNA